MPAEVKEGKVSVSGGRYYVTIGEKKNELDPKTIISSEPLDKALPDGATIAAKIIVATDNSVLAIILKKIRILCYKPVAPLRKAIDKNVRTAIVNTMILEDRLPAALAKELLEGFKT